MGVPINFLDKYDPDQFEIIGITDRREEFSKEASPTKRYVNPIQHHKDGSVKSGSTLNFRSALVTDDDSGVYYTADNSNEKLRLTYRRILIKRKN